MVDDFKEDMMANENSILVVDDEPEILDLFSQAFSKAGYSVIPAGSAEDALRVLNDISIHVMFIDLNLPGMNGIDLCREIRKRKGQIIIIYAVTGYISLFELSDCRAAGFDDYFTKPADLKLLIKSAGDAFDKIHRWKKR